MPAILNATEIANDHHWFPEALDWRGRELHVVKTDRFKLCSMPFLKETFEDKTLPRGKVRIDELPSAFDCAHRKPKLNFIWHTSFCCSTLISQVIDIEDCNLSLREPDVLNILAQMKRSTGSIVGTFSTRVANATLGLLSRPFDSGPYITVKPSNVANYLIRDLAQLTDGKMVFLYSDCRSFLLAVAKRGEARRGYVRRLFAEMLKDGHEQANWIPAKLFEFSDLQIAALIWHMQMVEFHRSIAALGSERFVSLDCDAFLDAPEAGMKALGLHFGFEVGPKHVAQVMDGPMLRQNAKAPHEPIDAASRRRELQSTAPQLARDVDAIVGWSYDVCRGTPRGVPLPNALLPIEKSYHP